MTRVVFWQNIMAFYQTPHITSLAEIPGYEVVWVVKSEVPADRKAQGWPVPDLKNVTKIVDPSDKQIRDIVGDRPNESVHIFTGVFVEPLARKAFSMCVKTSARIGLLNEPPIPGNALRNAFIRPLHQLHKLIFSRRISFVLAIGHMSVNFYRSIGYRDVFPYGYWPDPNKYRSFSREEGQPFTIMYLGQLIDRKGVDLLITALSNLSGLKWKLIIMGNGEKKESLEQLAAVLKVADRITFLPAGPNDTATQLISNSDLFVLPSRHDGWGVVVNEALLCGVPVVCSNHCGGADLLQEKWRGETFEAGSTTDLTNVLKRWIEKGVRSEEESIRIQNWCQGITGAPSARYLASVIEYTSAGKESSRERPQPRWLQST